VHLRISAPADSQKKVFACKYFHFHKKQPFLELDYTAGAIDISV
jgi:hypothetical protein